MTSLTKKKNARRRSEHRSHYSPQHSTWNVNGSLLRLIFAAKVPQSRLTKIITRQ